MCKRFLSIFVFIPLFILPFFKSSYAEQLAILQTEDVIVRFEPSLRAAAEEVADIYPALKAELEESIGWSLDFRPAILLIKDEISFQKIANSNLIVAYAVPDKNLIVIDYSRMNTGPFTLGITMEHEMCHLLLHHHIQGDNLPKWLDEGVCQWVSNGIAEIIMKRRSSVLLGATLSGRHIRLEDLRERFPDDGKLLLLAYEESKSLVEYIIRKFGRNRLLQVLDQLKNGDEVYTAFPKVLSISLDELEHNWHSYLRKRNTWFTYISRNFYGILFFLSALAAIYGFIRLARKKRDYRDDDDEFYYH